MVTKGHADYFVALLASPEATSYEMYHITCVENQNFLAVVEETLMYDESLEARIKELILPE